MISIPRMLYSAARKCGIVTKNLPSPQNGPPHPSVHEHVINPCSAVHDAPFSQPPLFDEQSYETFKMKYKMKYNHIYNLKMNK